MKTDHQFSPGTVAGFSLIAIALLLFPARSLMAQTPENMGKITRGQGNWGMFRTTFGCLAAALFLCAAAPHFQGPITGPATITDGDTLRIGRERIRLFGIDAPEMSQT